MFRPPVRSVRFRSVRKGRSHNHPADAWAARFSLDCRHGVIKEHEELISIPRGTDSVAVFLGITGVSFTDGLLVEIDHLHLEAPPG